MAQGPWYCVVVGGRGGPKRAHATLEIAETEAARLHALNAGQFAVRVLETVSELPAMAPIQPPEPPQEKPQAVQVPAVKVKPKAGVKTAVQAQKAAPVVVVKKARKPVDLRG